MAELEQQEADTEGSGWGETDNLVPRAHSVNSDLSKS